MPRTAGQRSILLNLPIINFFTQAILYQPTMELIEKLLGDIILFSTLLLVVVYGLPGMVDYEMLLGADERFGYNPTTPDGAVINGESAWWKATQPAEPPSYLLGAYTTVSGFCLSVVFFGALFQKIAFSYSYIMITEMEQDGNPDSQKAWRRWCYVNCVIFLLLVIFLGTGMAFFYFEMYILVVVKWPDYGLMALGSEALTMSRSELDSASKVYFDLYKANLVLVLPIAGLFILCSIANFMVHGYYRKSSKRVAPDVEKPDKAEV